MKLENFKETNRKKTSIIIFSICCVFLIAGVVLYQSFALFEAQENFNLIEGNVGNVGDITFTYYVDGKISKTPSEKNTGYQFDSVLSSCTNNATIEWNYEIWGPNVTNLNGTKTKCKIYFKRAYEESILNGAYPVIKDELIPVVIANDGIVKKADETQEWYSYEKKNWANAVILKDESVTYQKNEIISEDNIESYFVWIPRYRYQIFNDTLYTSLTAVEDKPQRIHIEFENKWTRVSDGSTTGSWLSHPAFTSFESNGMWVGKFETSKSNSEADNSVNPSGVQIKPNVVSWRNIQVGNAFYTTYEYKRNLDSHMMKNTEWGAVAYLQHSKYGSETSVRINNNSDFKTGYSAVNEPTCGDTGTSTSCNQYGTENTITQSYNTVTGYLASTTANMSGIYDMAGGAWEYVMGMLIDTNGNSVTGQNSNNHSGFKGVYGEGGNTLSGYSWPENKYYDKYTYGIDQNEFTRRILGDAIGEMGPFASIKYESKTRQISSWYTDDAWFVYPTLPWFERGGGYYNGSTAGIFASGHDPGSAYQNGSFRLVLIP